MTPRAAPRLRRAYFDGRYGQLHVHNAIPAGGGFDELTTLICLHGEAQTGRIFAGVLAELGGERSIYALDLPGFGESDPAPGGSTRDARAAVVGDFLDSMRIRIADLYAIGEGGAIARKLAAERPAQIRRVVFLAEPPGSQGSLQQPSLVLDPGQAAGHTAQLLEFLR